MDTRFLDELRRRHVVRVAIRPDPRFQALLHDAKNRQAARPPPVGADRTIAADAPDV